MKKDKQLEIAKWSMQKALDQGADQVAVTVLNQRNIEIEFRDKKLEKLKESTQNSLSLKIYLSNKYSSHSTNDFRKETLDKLISEAVAGTKFLTPDEYRSLPDAKYYPQGKPDNFNLHDSAYEKIDAESRVDLARAIEASAMAQSDQIISSTSGYNDSEYSGVRLHSNGLEGDVQGTVFSTGAEVTVSDPNGGRPEDYYYARSRFFNALPDPEKLGKWAAQRALKKIGQDKIASGQYDMLVENRTCSRLIGMLISPMSGRALQQKSSFLEGKLGEKIASEKFTLIDDPLFPKGLGSRWYDGDGIAAKKRIMIDKGILGNYYIDDYYGRKLGMEPTTGSTSNLIVQPGRSSLDDLTKQITKGILITGFIGGNSNSTTGDFSFGIMGFLIENGTITKPVNEMNISGNAKTFWTQLAGVGNDPYPYSAWRTPSLLFEKVEFSGI
ncbi:TldD/PmbA family protein [candidate division KSB1 bacterium]|nr:TldD/PmbA family protein [candidate division KSB1 bacterium]